MTAVTDTLLMVYIRDVMFQQTDGAQYKEVADYIERYCTPDHVAFATLNRFVREHLSNVPFDAQPITGIDQLVDFLDQMNRRALLVNSLYAKIESHRYSDGLLYAAPRVIVYGIVMNALRDAVFGTPRLLHMIEDLVAPGAIVNQAAYDCCCKLLGIFPNPGHAAYQVRPVAGGPHEISALRDMIEAWKNRNDLQIQMNDTRENRDLCYDIDMGKAMVPTEEYSRVSENRSKLFYRFPQKYHLAATTRRHFDFNLYCFAPITTLMSILMNRTGGFNGTLMSIFMNNIRVGALHLLGRDHFTDGIDFTQLSPYLFELFQRYAHGDRTAAIEIEDYLNTSPSVYDRDLLVPMQRKVIETLEEYVHESMIVRYDRDRGRATFRHRDGVVWYMIIAEYDCELVTAYKDNRMAEEEAEIFEEYNSGNH